jgi:CBS domain-containing protein
MGGTINSSQLVFFSAHAPFDRMEQAHLMWMLEHMQLAYYAQGEVIISPEQGIAQRFLVIKQGMVHGEQDVAHATEEDTWLELAEGECFPLGALLAHRPVASIYRAGNDTFCYELPAADFHALRGSSAPFRDFCTRRIANLLEHSKRVIQAQYMQSSREQQSLSSPLSAIIRRPPVTCAPQTSVREALERMHEARIGSMIAADDAGRPLGILTLPDVLERIALPQADMAGAVIGVMTTQLITLPPQALAYEAALAMARHGCRHVLVVENGRLAGLVSEKDLFALQRVGLRQVGAAIRHARDLEGLQQAATDIRNMAHNMMAQGVAAEQLTQFISAFNDLLTARVIEMECARPDATPLAGRICWIALGSEGRFEQTLNTDQDNALIFTVPQGMTEEQVRGQLLPVAKRINDTLASCGFALCRGGVMASNPQWCLSQDEWKRTFSGWITNGTPQALLHASIFFDFRPLHGATLLAEELRQWLAGAARDNTRFLRQMAENALSARPPLGVVRDFVVGREHTLDLKLNGITPFVDAARIFSLATGVKHTSTIARLRASAAGLNIHPSEIESWIDAFLFIQVLRMRHHDAAMAQDPAAIAPDNRINPERLHELDRRILKEAFRQARKLQARLALEYHL